MTGEWWCCTLSTCSSSSSLGGWFKILRSSCAFGGNTAHCTTQRRVFCQQTYTISPRTIRVIVCMRTILSMCHSLSRSISLLPCVLCHHNPPRRRQTGKTLGASVHEIACSSPSSLSFADARRTSIAHCLTLLIVASSCETHARARWHWRINIKS